MHYGTLSYKLSVKYNLATLRINYVTALENPGTTTLTVQLVSAHKGGTPSPHPREVNGRGHRHGALHTQHFPPGPSAAGLLEK